MAEQNFSVYTSASLPLIGITFIFATLVAYALHYFKTKRHFDKMAGPPALPLVGNTHQFAVGGADFYEQIMKYSKDYEEHGIIRVWLGESPRVILFHADTVEELFNSTKHSEKSSDYRFLVPWLGTGLLISKGEKWHTRRKMLTPAFHFKILNNFLNVMCEQADIMVNKMAKHTGGSAFDVFPYITHCALDIICETAMGQTVNAQQDSDSDYVKAVYRLCYLVSERQKQPWFWPSLIYDIFGDGKETKECLRVLHNFTNKVIAERKEQFQKSLIQDRKKTLEQYSEGGEEHLSIGGRKKLALLDMLLHSSETETPLTDEDIREEVDTFMFEGHDTTAAGVTWASYFIGAYPEVQQKLHEEMDSIFGDSDRRATPQDIAQMKYLECVIKEALRIYPSVPFHARTFTEDCEIKGFKIPKGTEGIILVTALHRDAKYFPDPEKFDPDRFLTENTRKRHPYSYTPFSAGMRNCIGQKFAIMEEKVMLSAMLRKFNMTSTQKREELRPVSEIILRPEHGIWIKLTPRNEE